MVRHCNHSKRAVACVWRADAGPKNGKRDVGLAAAPDAEQWRRNLVRTLDFKQCRLLTIYNWESDRCMPGAVDARPSGWQMRPRAGLWLLFAGGCREQG